MTDRFTTTRDTRFITRPTGVRSHLLPPVLLSVGVGDATVQTYLTLREARHLAAALLTACSTVDDQAELEAAA